MSDEDALGPEFVAAVVHDALHRAAAAADAFELLGVRRAVAPRQFLERPPRVELNQHRPRVTRVAALEPVFLKQNRTQRATTQSSV